MARRKPEPVDAFVLVDVVYADGTQRSNRKVPQSALSGYDDAGDLRRAIEEQDRKIAELSGRAPLAIASIKRVKKR